MRPPLLALWWGLLIIGLSEAEGEGPSSTCATAETNSCCCEMALGGMWNGASHTCTIENKVNQSFDVDRNCLSVLLTPIRFLIANSANVSATFVVEDNAANIQNYLRIEVTNSSSITIGLNSSTNVSFRVTNTVGVRLKILKCPRVVVEDLINVSLVDESLVYVPRPNAPNSTLVVVIRNSSINLTGGGVLVDYAGAELVSVEDTFVSCLAGILGTPHLVSNVGELRINNSTVRDCGLCSNSTIDSALVVSVHSSSIASSSIPTTTYFQALRMVNTFISHMWFMESVFTCASASHCEIEMLNCSGTVRSVGFSGIGVPFIAATAAILLTIRDLDMLIGTATFLRSSNSCTFLVRRSNLTIMGNGGVVICGGNCVASFSESVVSINGGFAVQGLASPLALVTVSVTHGSIIHCSASSQQSSLYTDHTAISMTLAVNDSTVSDCNVATSVNTMSRFSFTRSIVRGSSTFHVSNGIEGYFVAVDSNITAYYVSASFFF